MPADVVVWPLGNASIIAGFWILLWFLGRPLLKLLKIIGGFIKRIAMAIQRFFQPIFEFLYRSFYTLMQVATAGLLGWVAVNPFLNGAEVEMLPQVEAGAAAAVMLGMAYYRVQALPEIPAAQRRGCVHRSSSGRVWTGRVRGRSGPLDI